MLILKIAIKINKLQERLIINNLKMTLMKIINLMMKIANSYENFFY